MWLELGCAGLGVHTHVLEVPRVGKKPVAMGLGPPFVIAQLLAPPPNIRGQAAFGSVHRGSPSAVGGIQH